MVLLVIAPFSHIDSVFPTGSRVTALFRAASEVPRRTFGSRKKHSDEWARLFRCSRPNTLFPEESVRLGSEVRFDGHEEGALLSLDSGPFASLQCFDDALRAELRAFENGIAVASFWQQRVSEPNVHPG